MHKILSIDVGEKRVGLAVTDDLAMTAFPFGFLSREESIRKIVDLILQENIDQIVVGLPYLPSGELGSQANDVQKFVLELQRVTSVVIDFENEVLSSAEAANRYRAMGRKIKDKGEIDAMAATIILEAYLNRKKKI